MYWITIKMANCCSLERLAELAEKISRRLAVEVGYHYSLETGHSIIGFWWNEVLSRDELGNMLKFFDPPRVESGKRPFLPELIYTNQTAWYIKFLRQIGLK